MITLGARENVVTWVPNEALATRVPPNVQHAVDSVRALMAAGTFTAAAK